MRIWVTQTSDAKYTIALRSKLVIKKYVNKSKTFWINDPDPNDPHKIKKLDPSTECKAFESESNSQLLISVIVSNGNS